MFRPLFIGATVACLATPALAGPCTERIAELGKAITATQEGAGPALASPATTSSTAPSGTTTQNQPASAATQTQGANQAMQMLEQAKQLDQQGKESECMQLTSRVGDMVPNRPK
jgi:hypothetical protein